MQQEQLIYFIDHRLKIINSGSRAAVSTIPDNKKEYRKFFAELS